MQRFIYGLIIGIGKIIPGVSGSIIAISLGVYEKSIDSINHFFKDIKKNTIYLLPLSLGILISIIFSSKIVIKLLNNYYTLTIFFFLGLIIGGIRDVSKHISHKYTPYTIISFTLIQLISIKTSNQQMISNNNIYQFIYLIIIGFIDAICMIVPGISGTAILMMLGCYEMLITVLSNLTSINHIVYNLSIIIPFLIGLGLGIIVTIKIVSYLFTNHYIKTYNIILGFLLSSILYMFTTIFKYKIRTLELIIGIILFIIGYAIRKKINHDD